MIIRFLGTGTSQGIPLINCSCSVCCSSNPKNKRLRTSVTIYSSGTTVLIDTSPDLRQQLLTYPVENLDAVLYTHSHADHIYGIDELRRFNQLQKKPIPVYGDSDTIHRISHVFDYAFGNGKLNPGLPNLAANAIEKPFNIKKLSIKPIELYHGQKKVLGFRIGNFAYCTDVNRIPRESYTHLKGLDVLVLDALRDRQHPTHFSLQESIEESEKIDAKKTYFIHMSHEIDHEAHGRLLPDTINFAYDGLRIDLSGGENENPNN